MKPLLTRQAAIGQLESQGYEVFTATDGEEALARAAELEPDLILLDIMLPRLDGISVVKRLKQDPGERFVPVILVTAKADARDVVAGLEAGGDDYLTKPFDHSALLARVRSQLRAKELHDKVQEQASILKSQAEQLAAWNALLEEWSARGPVFVWGAGAKGVTFCNLADPTARLSFGYAMNKQGRGVCLNERGQSLVDAVYRALGYRSNDDGRWV